MSDRIRIVASGTGVVSSIGIEDFAAALYDGKTGFSPSTILAEEALAGEVRDFDPKPWLGKKGIRVLDRCARLLAVACRIALAEAGFEEDQGEGDEELGLVAGTLVGGLSSIVGFDWSGLTDGPSYVNPMAFANTVINAAAGQSAIKHKLRGVNTTISTGQGSGLTAIHYAAHCLRLGRARSLLAGGVDELGQQTYEGMAHNGMLASDKSVRPFAKDRSGTMPGEAAALFLLETIERASERGRTPMVEVCGYGSAQDASRKEGLGYPQPELAARAMKAALADAGVQPEEIGGVIASANGSPGGDAGEAQALALVFGDRASQVPVCAPKAALGETLGGAGGVGAIVAALAINKGSLPPTATVSDVEFPLSLSTSCLPLQGQYVLVNSLGFYGDCAALVMGPCR
jgi:3-oxoacyl-[acyl-carrier-protein] synthase II